MENTNTTPRSLGRYADILYDRWFKRTFGEPRHERLMQLFLQALIPERKIKSLSFGPQSRLTRPMRTRTSGLTSNAPTRTGRASSSRCS